MEICQVGRRPTKFWRRTLPFADSARRPSSREISEHQRKGGYPVPTRPSLILLRLDLDGDTQRPSNDRRAPGGAEPQSSASREAIQAARSVKAEGFEIGVVFCPPRMRSVPSIKALLEELRGWPLQVLTEQILDLPGAWDPNSRSRSHAVHTHADDDMNLALPQDRLMTSAITEFYASRVVPFLLIGQSVLLAGSTESLTRLRRVLDGNGKPLSDQENIPSGEPLYYTFDRKLQPVPRRELHWYDLLHFRPL